jgi:hypothetical protein
MNFTISYMTWSHISSILWIRSAYRTLTGQRSCPVFLHLVWSRVSRRRTAPLHFIQKRIGGPTISFVMLKKSPRPTGSLQESRNHDNIELLCVAYWNLRSLRRRMKMWRRVFWWRSTGVSKEPNILTSDSPDTSVSIYTVLGRNGLAWCLVT